MAGLSSRAHRPAKTRQSATRGARRAFRPLFDVLEDRLAPAVVTWSGAGLNDLWSNGANWLGGAAPANGDDVRIAGTLASTEVLFDATVLGTGVTLNSLTSDGTNPVTEPFRINGDTLTLDGTGPFHFGSLLTLANGTMDGASTVTVNGPFTWSGGTMAGAGTTQITSASALTLDTATGKNLARTLQNDGVVNYTGAGLRFGSGTALGVLDNRGTCTVAGAGDGDILVNTLLAHRIDNSGTFRHDGSANTRIDVIFNNSNRIHVQAGTLGLWGGGSDSGRFDIDAGATLEFLGGTHTLDSASIVSGAGAGATFRVGAGTVIVNGSYDMAVTLINGGTMTANGLGSPAVLTTGDLNMTIGTLDGSGTVKVTGTGGAWSGGTMAGAGTTQITSTGALTLDTATGKNLARTLQNDGVVNYTGAGLRFGSGTALGVLDNRGTCTVAGAGDGDILVNTLLAHRIDNSGTFRHDGSANTRIDVIFNNSNRIHAQAGTLGLWGGGSDSGRFDIDAAATLEFLGGTHTLDSASIVSGAGAGATFRVGAGTVIVNGSYDMAVTLINGGTMTANGTGSPAVLTTGDLNMTVGTLDGSGTVKVTGTGGAWSGGTMAGAGTTQITSTGALTLDTATGKNLARTLQNDGAVNYTGAGLRFGSGTDVGVLDNRGIFIATGDGDLLVNTLLAHRVINAGTFTHTGAGTTTVVAMPFTNSGTIDVPSGMLALGSAGTLVNGLFNIESTGILNGVGTINAPVRNAGTINPGLSPGTMTINGTYTQTATGRLNVEFAGGPPTTFDRLIISGAATLAGTLSVTTTDPHRIEGTFPIMTFASRSGDFGTKAGLAVGDGRTWITVPGATTYELTTSAAETNDAPAAVAPIADLIVNENAPPVLNHADLNAVFQDPEDADASLTYTIIANTPGGIVTAVIEPDDTLDLSFVAGQSGVVQITVRATDPSGEFSEDRFQVTVNPVVDTPSVSDAATAEDTQSSAGLVVNRNPADGAEVTHFKITAITGGALFHSDGVTPISNNDFITVVQGNAGLKFTPAAHLNSPAGDVFRFQVQASSSASDAGLGGGLATATIAVTEVNDAPTGTDDNLSSVAEDSGTRTITFASLLANDSRGPGNEHGQTLTITAVDSAVGGSVSLSGSDVLFTPAADFHGEAGFRYTLQDNGTTNGSNDFQTSTASVRFTVTAVNDAPIITSGNFTVPENTTAVGTVTAPDPENNDVSFDLIGGADQVHFTINPTTGELSFNAAPDFEAPADADGDNVYELIVQVTDGAASSTQMFTVTVTDVNEDPPLSPYAVITTADNGNDAAPTPGSLRAAIRASNDNPGVDTIVFDIGPADLGHVYYADDGVAGQVNLARVTPTSETDDADLPTTGPLAVDPDWLHSWWSIEVPGALPSITDPAIIDAYTQPGAAANTSPAGNDAVLRIELNGAGAGIANGLHVTAGDSTVRGLAINRFSLSGIHLETGGNNFVAGNFLGTDVSGTLDLGNAGSGVLVSDGASNSVIGGTVAEAANVISGNDVNGIWIIDAGSNGTIIRGNIIGLDASGTIDLGNGNSGVFINGGFGAVVGGDDDDDGALDGFVRARNLISGNATGIALSASGSDLGTLIQGNYIGTDVTGTLDRGNSTGVSIGSAPGTRVGGTTPGAGNVIAGNNTGVFIFAISHPVIGGQYNSVVEGNLIGVNAAGDSALGNTNGMIVSNSDNLIGGTAAGAGNVISGNAENGIWIKEVGSDGTIIQGNIIGLDVTGDVDLGNGNAGVFINEGFGTRIGGDDDDDGALDGIVRARNVISGNSTGIALSTSGSNYATTIQGNYIGTDVDGSADLGNSTGVSVGSAPGTRVGGTAPGAGNVISGNNTGVFIFGISHPVIDGQYNSQVQGNLIGLDADGDEALGNTTGILVTNSDNLIGGTAAGAGNVISGNEENGIWIKEVGSDGTVIQGNIIGLDVTGDIDLGNGNAGVFINEGFGTLIGGDDDDDGALDGVVRARNIISGNSTGIALSTSGSNYATTIQGNYIGTDVDGSDDLGNSTGVSVGSAPGTRVGGATPGAGNVISGNNTGVFIFAISHPVIDAQYNSLVQGNIIGLDADGDAALGNTNGILVTNSDNLIGGTAAGAGNIISGNTERGIWIKEVGSDHNVIQGNIIGLDASGTIDRGNENGVFINEGLGTLIGGDDDDDGVLDGVVHARNIISGNHGGVVLSTSGSDYGTIIQGNYIGTDLTGLAPRGNSIGVSVGSAPGTLVGGTTPGAGNVISGNVTGVDIFAISHPVIDGLHNSRVQSNLIGLKADGSTALGNVTGVIIHNSDNLIGGATAGNVIAFNTGAGVLVLQSASVGNTIQGNSIHSNGGLGIDLGNNGVTANDAGDTDTGPNQLQNYPDLSSASAGATSRVVGRLEGAAGAAFTVDFYASAAADPSGFGEGQRYLGAAAIVLDTSGYFTVALAAAVAVGEFVTATATDAAGNTSEFAANVAAGADLDGVAAAVEDGAPGGGDGNNDGTPDSQQDHVASLPNAADGQYVTLVSQPGNLAGVAAVANPSPGDAPAGVSFPIGFLDFEVVDVAPGGAATVTLHLPAGVTVDTYYKYGATPTNPAPHWYEFLFDGVTGAEIAGGLVTLHFVDGQRGDDDGIANGVIVDPGAPALTPTASHVVLHDGVLDITGTEGRDVIHVTRHSDSVRVHLRLNAQDCAHDDDDDDAAYEIHERFEFPLARVSSIVIHALGGDDHVKVGRRIELPATIDGGDGDDSLRGGSGNDTIVDLLGDNRIRSGPGNDAVTTGAGHDSIWTDGGDDTVSAGHGDNRIWTDGANDVVTAGDGDNEIHAGWGDNVITVGHGNNRIWTRDGDDVISTGDGNNEIHAGAGNDLITTGGGCDTIHAGAGSDLVRAGGGHDSVEGGAGSDVLLGGDGNDTLIGGDGRDMLVGGFGSDHLVGNASDDILIAGTTAHDANDVALQSLMQEWTGGGTYHNRIANITSGTGLTGGYRLIGADGAGQTVFNDDDVDTLDGKQGQDWFFANRVADNGGAVDKVTDLATGEQWYDTDF